MIRFFVVGVILLQCHYFSLEELPYYLFSHVQEIKFEPNVMCERIDKNLAFRSSQVTINRFFCAKCFLASSVQSVFFLHKKFSLEMIPFICIFIDSFCSLKMEISFAFRNLLGLVVMNNAVTLMCLHF